MRNAPVQALYTFHEVHKYVLAGCMIDNITFDQAEPYNKNNNTILNFMFYIYFLKGWLSQDANGC